MASLGVVEKDPKVLTDERTIYLLLKKGTKRRETSEGVICAIRCGLSDGQDAFIRAARRKALTDKTIVDILSLKIFPNRRKPAARKA